MLLSLGIFVLWSALAFVGLGILIFVMGGD